MPSHGIASKSVACGMAYKYPVIIVKEYIFGNGVAVPTVYGQAIIIVRKCVIDETVPLPGIPLGNPIRIVRDIVIGDCIVPAIVIEIDAVSVIRRHCIVDDVAVLDVIAKNSRIHLPPKAGTPLPAGTVQIAISQDKMFSGIPDVDAVPQPGAVNLPTINYPRIPGGPVPARDPVGGREVRVGVYPDGGPGGVCDPVPWGYFTFRDAVRVRDKRQCGEGQGQGEAERQ